MSKTIEQLEKANAMLRENIATLLGVRKRDMPDHDPYTGEGNPLKIEATKPEQPGYMQRLIFLRDYFNGDKPITVIMQHRQIVELLDSIIRDVK